MLHSLLLFLVFLVYPIIEGIRLSLFRINYQNEIFVGFDNYKTLFQDPVFLKSTLNTVIFVVFIVALTVIFAFLLLQLFLIKMQNMFPL